MDGWQFLEEYEKLENLQKRGVMIIMLTGSLNPDDKTRSDNISNISDFKNKPISIEMIGDIMQNSFRIII